MNKYTTETQNIYKIIELHQPIRLLDIASLASISKKNLYTHLKRLVDDKKIQKVGTVPKVYYVIDSQNATVQPIISQTDFFIEQNYIYVSPSGEVIRGISGFNTWCELHSFNTNIEKEKYVKVLKALHKLKRNGVISAKKIILSSKNKHFLDNIFFSDFYTVNYFGKTKLGQLVYLAKASQNKVLIREIVSIIKPTLEHLISVYEIETVGFIPPTIDRKTQFMSELEKQLDLPQKRISINKVPSPTKIPQKSLRKLEDRISNAQRSIALNFTDKFRGNVLIIDDATGSGATLNETAKKIKNIADKKIKVYGYSIVGSYKGFDVISEV